MYFIRKETELLGKEIMFTHFAQFAGAMVIITKDKGVFICDKDDEGIEIYNEPRAMKHIFYSNYLKHELNKLNILTDDEILEYKKQMEEKRRKEQEEYKKQQIEKEYQDYLRLKKKYEGVK
jgi:hypothetical protein